MEQLPNKKNYLIFLCHSDKDLEFQLFHLILNEIKNVEVQTFENRKLLENSDNVKEADLIIMDIKFDIESFEDIYNLLTGLNKKTSATYLIFTNHNTFDENKISFTSKENIVCEFLNDITFRNFIFVNRVKVLLNISKIIKKTFIELQKIQSGIWNLMDHSNMFMVMLDKDMNIKLVNHHLTKVLGYNNSSELIGLNWSQFLKSPDIEIILHVISEILKGSKNYKEFTNDILFPGNQAVTVRWFNTLINSDFNCVFSIGLPLTKVPSIDEDIDNIRSYFKEILEQDKNVINAMKEVTMKYSEKILRNSYSNLEKRKTNDCSDQ